MKELTMEEKAKAYDEALERAKEIIKAMTNIGGVAKVDDIQYLFPELKENEDERIRKFIIKCIEELQKSCTENADFNGKCSSALCWLEKQSEQKLADKANPKFKVGDWVAINPELRFKSPLCIKYIDNNNYRVESVDGNSGIPTIDYLDNHYHLWTLRDAKDGDILASYNDENPFIFKGCIDLNNPNAPVAYCGIDCSNKFYVYVNPIFWWTNSLVHPAEKAQREFLFQKMKEAGYEWDANKKELNQLHIIK